MEREAARTRQKRAQREQLLRRVLLPDSTARHENGVNGADHAEPLSPDSEPLVVRQRPRGRRRRRAGVDASRVSVVHIDDGSLSEDDDIVLESEDERDVAPLQSPRPERPQAWQGDSGALSDLEALDTVSGESSFDLVYDASHAAADELASHVRVGAEVVVSESESDMTGQADVVLPRTATSGRLIVEMSETESERDEVPVRVDVKPRVLELSKHLEGEEVECLSVLAAAMPADTLESVDRVLQEVGERLDLARRQCDRACAGNLPAHEVEYQQLSFRGDAVEGMGRIVDECFGAVLRSPARRWDVLAHVRAAQRVLSAASTHLGKRWQRAHDASSTALVRAEERREREVAEAHDEVDPGSEPDEGLLARGPLFSSGTPSSSSSVGRLLAPARRRQPRRSLGSQRSPPARQAAEKRRRPASRRNGKSPMSQSLPLAHSPSRASTPTKPHRRSITRKQLHEVVDNLYSSFDRRPPHAAKETLREHLDAFLKQRYGLKSLRRQMKRVILQAIDKYAATPSVMDGLAGKGGHVTTGRVADGDDLKVLVFRAVLHGEVDEDFRFIERDTRRECTRLLRVLLEEMHPLKSAPAIQRMLSDRTNLKVHMAEREWKELVHYMHKDAPEDAARVDRKVYLAIEGQENRSRRRSRHKVKSEFGHVAFDVLLRVLVEDQLVQRMRELEPLREVFGQLDPDSSGYISAKQAKYVFSERDGGEVKRFLASCDPFCPRDRRGRPRKDALRTHVTSGQTAVSFSECARFFLS